MNLNLRFEIVKHIFSSFGVIPSKFVDDSKSHSLTDDKFLLKETIKFDQNTIAKVWGCQLSAESQELRVLVTGIPSNDSMMELSMLVQLKDNPCYGLYLILDSSTGESVLEENLIACSLDGEQWLECNTFLQSSFLTGMEQVKEIGLTWKKCSDHREEFRKLVSFIEFHQLLYGDTSEGQED